MGKLSRDKGAGFEREVAGAFRHAGFQGARRGLGQARAANEVPDVDAHPKLWPELKRGKRTNPRAALVQAIEASSESGRIPVAITRDDAADPIVTMRFADWLEMFARVYGP